MALLGLAALVRVALSAGTDLYFDEAYYWQWAQALDWSYFDHPPLVAWLIAALGVRTGALLCGAATVGVVGLLARDVYGSGAAGLRAAALYSVVPAAVLAGVWVTPDTPLLLFWALTLWALHHERWVLAGLAAGLAMLAKYPALLLGAAYLCVAARERRLPRGIWATLGLGALLFLPVVLWNAQHGWVGFGFQLKHGLGGRGGLATFGEFLLGQVGMAGPGLFLFTLAWGLRGPKEQRLLRAAALVPLAAFGLAALRTRGEANWPCMAYVAACVGLAGASRRWQLAAGLGALLITLGGASHVLFPVVRPERDVLLSRAHGWRTLERLADPELLFPGAPDALPSMVWTPSYQLASQVAYYAHVPTSVAEGRVSQYDLWPEPPLSAGQDALWVSEYEEPPASLTARFGRVEGPVALPAEYLGRRVHTFRVWRLVGLRGP
ncbi:glycosyltransferase family 39 protein [Aggregicoccus sp. 17bor-14]|nr:glycosyltransferase family 39 protein [Simulacricoccus sp. 17bor-14]MRI90280.1 glycosyltransferase family 39 protein [Aggregicoccus sp. 17bor-14]